MEDKKGMFTGFSKVYSFTAYQNIKGKGFKVSTILIGLLIAAIFAAISIIQALSQDNETDEYDDINSAIDVEEQFAADIYVVNKTNLPMEMISGIKEAEMFKDCQFITVDEKDYESATEDTNTYLAGKDNAIVMSLADEEKELVIKYYIPNESSVDRDGVDTLSSAFENYYEYVLVSQLDNLDESAKAMYIAGVNNVDTLKAGDEPDDMGVMVAKLIVPMLFSLVLYMMVLMYGQNITKIVVAEKSSKLMETLLTSVKPYAIISGKILAVVSIAVFQMFIWVASGIIGFIAGDAIATSINSNYVNYMTEIINIIKESSDAFDVLSIMVAILMVVIGFLLFSVLAGLVAAMVDKVEDISSAMSLFQLPVVVGFLAAYFVDMTENEGMKTVIRYCPLTSPFSVPSQMLVGEMGTLGGFLSLLLVVVTTFVLILFTGKVYKGKLFNRH